MIILGLLCLLMDASELVVSAQDDADEQAIRALVQTHTTLWREGRAEELSQLYAAESNTFSLRSGRRRTHDRSGIEEFWRLSFSRRDDRGTTTLPRDFRVISVLVLTPRVGIVDGVFEIGPGSDATGNQVPLVRDYVTAIVVKKDDRWEIVKVSNGGPQPQPGPTDQRQLKLPPDDN